MPLVSILIPTYNRAHLIGETLESIISQNYENWECLVIDDWSNDQTNKLLGFYCGRDSRIRYYQRPVYKPKGANACRNFGYTLSKGDLIIWFDSDDIMFENYLSYKVELYRSIEKKPDLIISQTGTFISNGRNRVGLEDLKLVEDDFYNNFLFRKSLLSLQAGLWKSTFLKKHYKKELPFDENLYQSQDFDFYFRTFQYNPVIKVLKENFFGYRKGIESISTNFLRNDTNHVLSFLKVREKILHLHKNDNQIYYPILNQVVTALRNDINNRNYIVSKYYLKFLKKHAFLKSRRLTLGYLKVSFFFRLCKIYGGGAYFFKDKFFFDIAD